MQFLQEQYFIKCHHIAYKKPLEAVWHGEALVEWQLYDGVVFSQVPSKSLGFLPISLVMPEPSATRLWGCPRNRKVGDITILILLLSMGFLSLQASHLPKSLCTLPVFFAVSVGCFSNYIPSAPTLGCVFSLGLVALSISTEHTYSQYTIHSYWLKYFSKFGARKGKVCIWQNYPFGTHALFINLCGYSHLHLLHA